MSSYSRMRETLKPIGLYKLDGTTLLDCELQSYAWYFDIMHERIEQMFTELFIDSVTSRTIARFANLYALPPSVSIALLQEIVGRRNKISNLDFTIDGVKRCLAAGGITATLTENFTTNTVSVAITEDKGIFTDKAQRNEFIRQVMPCHVNVTIA